MARPRKYDPGEEPTGADRKQASRHALASRGGRLLQVALEPEEALALERIRDAHRLATDRDAIGFALAAAAKKCASA